MHQAVRDLIKHVRKEMPYKFRFKKVLEVGSKIINGSPRKYFWFCKYVGVDLSKGKGVDIVGDFTWEATGNFGNYSEFDNAIYDEYDVVVSTEMLEHCEKWKFALERMYGVLKSNGLLLITTAGIDRPEHGTYESHPEDSPETNDYYGNISTEQFKEVLPPSLFKSYTLMYGRGFNDLYFYGIKK